MIEDIKYKAKILTLTLNKFFDLKIAKPEIINTHNYYSRLPSLFFKGDSNFNYNLLKNAIQSFEGNLKWEIGKSHKSKDGFIIAPLILFDFKFNKENSILLMDMFTEEGVKYICDFAMKDIENLCFHVERKIKADSLDSPSIL